MVNSYHPRESDTFFNQSSKEAKSSKKQGGCLWTLVIGIFLCVVFFVVVVIVGIFNYAQENENHDVQQPETLQSRNM